jgi:hypothetical protein
MAFIVVNADTASETNWQGRARTAQDRVRAKSDSAPRRREGWAPHDRRSRLSAVRQLPSRETYFAVMIGWPRRFCCQQPSDSSRQTGVSSPLLTVAIRSGAMPRLTR